MKQSVLVVHDDPRLLAGAASKLESAGFQVLRASSLAEARRHLETSPSMVFTSLRLGDLPREFAPDRMRAENPGLHIVLLAGQEELAEGRASFGSCDDLVVSPFEDSWLAKTANAHARKVQLEQRINEMETGSSESQGEGNGSTAGTNSLAPFLEPDQIRPFQQYERDILLHALHTTGWNVKETATRLKIGRATLYRKIDRYDLRSFRRQAS